MDTLKTPGSPSLPNQETDAPISAISPTLGAELDLNDETDEDAEGDIPMSEEMISKPVNKVLAEFQEFEHSDSISGTTDDAENPLSCNISNDKNYVTPMIDFSDPVKAPFDLINPFGANNTLSSSEPIPIEIVESHSKKLSEMQELKISEYIDEKLQLIQRDFVKYLSVREEEEESIRESVSWGKLIHKIDDVVEFIWYAMSKVKGVPIIYHANVIVDDSLKVIFTHKYPGMKEQLDTITKHNSMVLLNGLGEKDEKSGVNGRTSVLRVPLPRDITSNSGYVSYCIKLMGDFIDYIVKYQLEDIKDWIILLRVLGKIDNVMSILIDYDNLGEKQRMIISTTDKVRIASIIQRTKIAAVELFDRFVREGDGSLTRVAVDNFQVFVGELYEGLVDRTSI